MENKKPKSKKLKSTNIVVLTYNEKSGAVNSTIKNRDLTIPSENIELKESEDFSSFNLPPDS